MDHINFDLIDSSFDNLDLNVFSSTKEETNILSSIREEMDARKGNFSFIMKNKKKGLSKVFFIDLDVYRKNGAEEQKRKEGLQAISSAIQVSLKCLVIFYAWHDVEFCSLMHIRRNRKIINRLLIIMRTNGTITTINSPADALCYLYTINYPLPKKKKKKYQLIVHPKQEEKEK